MANQTGLSAVSIVVRSRGVVEATVDGEVVALNIDKGICYGLNRVGSRIWDIIAEPSRVADVCARLVSEYDVDHETCERQVLDLLQELRGEGLVEMVVEAAASEA